MANKYAEELQKIKGDLEDGNPFNKPKENVKQPIAQKEEEHTPYYESKQKNGGYFDLILSSDFEDIEMEVRGLRYVSANNTTDGRKTITVQRKKNHYLTEDGAENILMFLKGHLSSDIKLGLAKEEDFYRMQEIVRKTFIKFVRNNLQSLGMDTEEKQRKARPLIVMILNRIWYVYSRSVDGSENIRTHGDMNVNAKLDMERQSEFGLEDLRN